MKRISGDCGPRKGPRSAHDVRADGLSNARSAASISFALAIFAAFGPAQRPDDAQTGFIAARYTAEVLQGISGPLTRASVLAAFRRRQDMNLGGFSVAFQGRKRANAYVTQSMLTSDGRIVG